MPIGTRSVDCTMPLAMARIHQPSMSRVMPRSWPTTMPLVTTSTWQPRSASSSATEVAWWKPISSMTRTEPKGSAEPASTSRTSTTFAASPGTHQGRAASAPVATMTWSGRRSSTSPGHTPTPYSTLTPSRRHSVSWLRTMSPSSARLGTEAASRTCPPAAASFS